VRPAPAAYVLVLLDAVETGGDVEEGAHEEFVDSLIARNLVLLGGELELGTAFAAYVLRASLADAESIVAEDPLVVAGVAQPRFVPWELVGVNPDAIDEVLIVRPGDIA
jgi:uncharacterized protein YciI